MAVCISVFIEGVTAAQYDEVQEHVLASGSPAGCLIHTAAPAENGWQVWDIWETAEQFDTFMNTVLGPKFGAMGLTSKPHITVLPLHNIWTPGAAQLTKLGESGRLFAQV